jgi:hypothetical protein
MSVLSNLSENFSQTRITLLGAGPMSVVSTDAIIELANKYNRSIAMIPSRRQIECEELGGGYVNKWTTEEFTSYVRTHDKANKVLLSRDHSGPWQFQTGNTSTNVPSHKEAMNEVKVSLKIDIESDFDLIHIDPSPGLKFGLSQEQVEDDIIELVEFCVSVSKKQINFEIGADEQSFEPESVDSAEEALVRILNKLRKNHLPEPVFYVVQTGTKVMETRNIGSFNSEVSVEGMIPPSVQVPKMLKMLGKYGLRMKEHNADYLSDDSLTWHSRYGIHAANVAPEFGVVETRALIEIAKRYNYNFFIEKFSRIVLENRKWEKWMLKDSLASDFDKVEIAGHYHFSDLEIIEIREKMKNDLATKNLDLDKIVRTIVADSIDRYLKAFGYAQ